MLRLPIVYRSEDDHAPVDYSFVSSVDEGLRARQAEALHARKQDASLGKRVDPIAGTVTDENGTRERPDVVQRGRGTDAARRLPTAADGFAPAARVAYPLARDDAFVDAPERPQEARVYTPEAAAARRRPPDFAPQSAPVADGTENARASRRSMAEVVARRAAPDGYAPDARRQATDSAPMRIAPDGYAPDARRQATDNAPMRAAPDGYALDARRQATDNAPLRTAPDGYALDARRQATDNAPMRATPDGYAPDARRQATDSAPMRATPDGYAPDARRQATDNAPMRIAPDARRAPLEPTSASPSATDDFFTQDGSQYAPPVKAEIPDWLKTAQQNNLPLSDAQRRRRAPMVQPAKRVEDAPPPVQTDLLGRPIRRAQPNPAPRRGAQTADRYAEAGYPPELVERQRRDDTVQAEIGVRKRHGAQYAAPPPEAPRRRPAAARTPDEPSASELPPDSPLRRRQTPDPASFAPRGYDPQSSPMRQAPDARPFDDGASRQAVDRRARRPDEDARRAGDGYAQTPNGGYPRTDGLPADAPRAAEALYRVTSEPAPNRRRAPQAENASPDWQDDESDAAPMAKDRRPVPVLGIAVFAAAALLVALWIMQLTFTAQREDVLTARADAEAAIASQHPYRYRELIEREAEANNLHPAFVAAIVLSESSFNADAESSVGARGLMQMMPDAYKFVYDKIQDGSEYNFDAMYDADTNVKYACYYLAFLSERFRADPILVSAAFHAGQTTVQNWLNSSTYSADGKTITLDNMMEGPTKNYAAKVTKNYAIYRRLFYEQDSVPSTVDTSAVNRLVLDLVRHSPQPTAVVSGGVRTQET